MRVAARTDTASIGETEECVGIAWAEAPWSGKNACSWPSRPACVAVWRACRHRQVPDERASELWGWNGRTKSRSRSCRPHPTRGRDRSERPLTLRAPLQVLTRSTSASAWGDEVAGSQRAEKGADEDTSVRNVRDVPQRYGPQASGRGSELLAREMSHASKTAGHCGRPTQYCTLRQSVKNGADLTSD